MTASVSHLFTENPLLPLFVSIALGFLLGRLRFGMFRLGGIPGTLFAAILVGQLGVVVDPILQTLAFAMFIYTLGFSCGPQFFASLGKDTLSHLHLSVFSAITIMASICMLWYAFDLDVGTAAGVLSGAVTESAAIGTASEALSTVGFAQDEVARLRTNIGVTYALTYLFGFTLVIIYTTVIAPRLLGVTLKTAAADYEQSLGGSSTLSAGQGESPIPAVTARLFQITNSQLSGITVEAFRQRFGLDVALQQVVRSRKILPVQPDLVLRYGDRIALLGKHDSLVGADAAIGRELSDIDEIAFTYDTAEVVVTSKEVINQPVTRARRFLLDELSEGLFATRILREGREIPIRDRTIVQAGDIVTFVGAPDPLNRAIDKLGYRLVPSANVDYVYLGLGVLTGLLIGMIKIPLAGAEISLETGGGCLLSGLAFGWLRGKSRHFGSMPSAAAIHIRDFGMAIFIASVGLASGPKALEMIQTEGIALPLMSMGVVFVCMTLALVYARLVLKMQPIIICGALAGLFTCTAALNALVAESESETPVLGYTVCYAVANVLLTMMGTVLVIALA